MRIISYGVHTSIGLDLERLLAIGPAMSVHGDALGKAAAKRRAGVGSTATSTSRRWRRPRHRT
eukprot:711560-Prorocentrum_lima.AAC.1